MSHFVRHPVHWYQLLVLVGANLSIPAMNTYRKWRERQNKPPSQVVQRWFVIISLACWAVIFWRLITHRP